MTLGKTRAARPHFGLGRALGTGTLVLLLGTIAMGGAGCLSRDVVYRRPTTKTAVGIDVSQGGVKLDLLFGIDNSASMGDKQVILSQAIPDLLTRLFTPNCVDGSDHVVGVSDAGGKCTTGRIEFPPVRDMHIGIVSSSLGARGGDLCDSSETNPVTGLPRKNDDLGHLINRVGDREVAAAEAKSPANFLAWLPGTDAPAPSTPSIVPPLADSAKLKSVFADLVQGVHEYGCGYEAQMESVYRFLVQPDPSTRVVRNGDVAQLAPTVDSDLLKQRHDFLRPDSLVAVILVTDENESTIDPLAIGGKAWHYTSAAHVQPGTSACDAPPGPGTGPNDPKCISTYLPAAANDAKYGQQLDEAHDAPSLRFLHTKQRYGVDPRFPVSRYSKGFSALKIPDRNGEHPRDAKGTPSPDYVGHANCVNPLFATDLPTDATRDLCDLKAGPRRPDMVFYGLIGGVPWQLLTEEPTNLSASNTAAFKKTLQDDDWTRILGKDPFAYDFTGIDPHMLESDEQRPGVGADDAHTREWNTKKVDLQYACTFPFPDTASTPLGRKDCTDPKLASACDCAEDTDSPLCDPVAKHTQTKGKAYPTVSELAVAKALGDQAVVASICPRSNDPKQDDYGYRPAVRAIVDRLKNQLDNTCVPQPLVTDGEGKVPCLVLETLAAPGPQAAACDASKGLQQPDPTILARFRQQQVAAARASGSGVDRSALPVCEVVQLADTDRVDASCATSHAAGWCYVQGEASHGCPQAIKFSAAGNPKPGATVSLLCVERSDDVTDPAAGEP